jgi:hypothetical protein
MFQVQLLDIFRELSFCGRSFKVLANIAAVGTRFIPFHKSLANGSKHHVHSAKVLLLWKKKCGGGGRTKKNEQPNMWWWWLIMV